MLEKIEGRRRKGHQKMRWLEGITDAVDMNLGKLWKMVRDRETWYAAIHGAAESDAIEQQQIALKAELDLVGEAEGRTKDDLQVFHLCN